MEHYGRVDASTVKLITLPALLSIVVSFDCIASYLGIDFHAASPWGIKMEYKKKGLLPE